MIYIISMRFLPFLGILATLTFNQVFSTRVQGALMPLPNGGTGGTNTAIYYNHNRDSRGGTGVELPRRPSISRAERVVSGHRPSAKNKSNCALTDPIFSCVVVVVFITAASLGLGARTCC